MVNPLLSIIVPTYNEGNTVGIIIQRIRHAGIANGELIIVDDGSTDNTREVLTEILSEEDVLITSPNNEGKTAAVRRGLLAAKGQYVVIQDADLEYDPSTIPQLLRRVRETSVAVYGTRPSYWGRPSRWLFAGGVLAVDTLIWAVHGRFIRDHACCYKLLPRETLNRLQLESTGFEGCIEITVKLIRSKIPIRQVSISYSPRGRGEGKKLTWRYGLRAIAAIWRYRDWSP